MATLVVRNAGSSDCVLNDGTFDFGIRDRADKWMARWDGGNEFPGPYAPAQEGRFSLPTSTPATGPDPLERWRPLGIPRLGWKASAMTR